MVFALTLLQHRWHGWSGETVNSFLPTWLLRLHSCELVGTCRSNKVESLWVAIEQRARTREGGVLVVRAGERELTAHKVSDLLQFLSVVTVRVESRSKGLVTYRITSTSASLLPPWLPLAWVFTLLLGWIPFHDGGVNAIYAHDFHKRVLLPAISQLSPRGKLSPSGKLSMKGNEAFPSTYPAQHRSILPPSMQFFATFIITPIFCIVFALILLAPSDELN